MKFFIILVFLALVLGLLVTVSFAGDHSDEVSSKAQRIRDLFKNVSINSSLVDELDDFEENYDHISKWLKEILNPSYQRLGMTRGTPFDCIACRALLGLVVSAIRLGLPQPVMQMILILMCTILQVEKPEVCEGAVKANLKDVSYIVSNHRDLKVADVCSIILGSNPPHCPQPSDKFTNWTVRIEGNKPLPSPSPNVTEEDEQNAYTILQLTDIHPDLRYKIGSNTTCGKQMCCRELDGMPEDPKFQAGPWGDYHCDLPFDAMKELFTFARNAYDYELILMTGDIVHHAAWTLTQQENEEHMDSVNNLLPQLFPNKTIYPVIGNHEPHPSNLFPTMNMWSVDPTFNRSWVYSRVGQAYSTTLTPEALATFSDLGYYTMMHKDKLRLIVLNTNFCYTHNYWIYFNPGDIEEQLQWMANVLHQAEASEEVVYIIGHVAPGKFDCWPAWNTQYNRIILRYENIVKAQFFGHTHNDEVKIFFDDTQTTKRPFSTLFIGGSATSHVNSNPGFKVYFAERATGEWNIVNHETWGYNLTKANESPGGLPAFYKFYNAKQDFGLKSLHASYLYEWTVRMLFNDTAFHTYWRTFHMDAIHVVDPCNTIECRMDILCEIVKADSGDFRHCNILWDILAESDKLTTTTTATSSFLLHPFKLLITMFPLINLLSAK